MSGPERIITIFIHSMTDLNTMGMRTPSNIWPDFTTLNNESKVNVMSKMNFPANCNKTGTEKIPLKSEFMSEIMFNVSIFILNFPVLSFVFLDTNDLE